ncbi:MAG: efflux RND transporter periplasmic adaptor subunit [Methylophilaceae bacterium]
MSKTMNSTDETLGNIPEVEGYLQTFCERTQDVSEGAILLLETDSQALNRAAQWPEPRELSAPMINTANAAIKRLRSVTIIPAVSEHGSEHSCIIAVPIQSGRRVLGVAVLTSRTSDSEVTAKLLTALEQATKALTVLLKGNPAASRPADIAKLLQLQSAILDQDKLNDALGAFANELAAMLKFNRVSVGLMKNHHINIAAISNSADFNNNQGLLQTISAAMEEAADQVESIAFPVLEDGKPQISRAHEVLLNKTGHTVYSIPLVANKEVMGVITLEQRGETPPNSEALIWYEHIANFVAPLFALKQRAELSWYQRSKASIKAAWGKFIQKDNYMPKIVLGVALLALAALTLIPVTYNIGAPAHIEGATQRILAAPTDGFIQKVNARPGDIVKAGDVLVGLADQDLLLEKNKWESEVAQQENNFSGALARQDRTQYAISQAKASQAKAELALIKQQLARSRIISPIEGIVLEGDLSQSLGAPVKLGDTLMIIAPNGEYRLMINIDERDIANISIGQKGYLALTAQPIKKMAFVIERITPMATIKDGRNTFEAEAKLTNSKLYLRPGLQGVAKIEAGKRPVLWRITHRIMDWIRLTLWKWGI